MTRRRVSLKRCLALLALMAVAPRTRAQYRDWIQQDGASQWYAVPRVEYLRMDVEAEQEKMKSSGAPNMDTTRLYLSPRIGIGWDNYIYHPYLLTYSMVFEPGYVWQDRSANGKAVDSSELILDGTFRANVLQAKPYATSLYYARAREDAKYGFFSTATVDTESWGATTGYREGPVPVEVSFDRLHEDSTDFNQTTISDQSLLNLRARNERQGQDFTELNYQFSQFDRSTKGVGYNFSNESTYNHVSLVDFEHFERSDLKSSARLNSVDSQTSSSTDLNAEVNYNVQHSAGLHSYYDYSFSRFTGNDNSDSTQNYGIAGIQHQLYESLSSGFEVHGSHLSSSAPDFDFDSKSAATTASAAYVKRLGSWWDLYLDNSTSYNFTTQQTKGSQLQIDNESHVVPTNSIVILSQPREIAVINVTDANSNPLQPADYTLIQTTDPWRIQINPLGPSHIQPGSTILVTYTIQTNPSGNYGTFANQSGIRVTFWRDHMGVYARYSFTDTSASTRALLLQNDELFEAGIDFNWYNIYLSANYQDDNSTFYRNRSYNLAENYSMNVLSHSTLGLNFNQQWLVNSSSAVNGEAPLPEQHMTFYNFLVHYEWRPLPRLTWSSEVGYQRQDGFGLDQNLFAARSYLNWMMGKLEMHLGYQHENQDFQRESRERDFVFLRARRNF